MYNKPYVVHNVTEANGIVSHSTEYFPDTGARIETIISKTMDFDIRYLYVGNKPIGTQVRQHGRRSWNDI